MKPKKKVGDHLLEFFAWLDTQPKTMQDMYWKAFHAMGKDMDKQIFEAIMKGRASSQADQK